MGEQKDIETNNMPQHPPWAINNLTCCYEGEHAPEKVGKRQHFLQYKIKHQKTQGKKWVSQQSSKTSPKEGPSQK